MAPVRELPIFLMGIGGVGQAVLRQILEHRNFHAFEYGVRYRFVGLADSSGVVLEPSEGLSDAQLQELLDLKAEGRPLVDHPLATPHDGDLCAVIEGIDVTGTVVVDCTASVKTIPALLEAHARGYGIVLANKKPLTEDLEVYHRLTRVDGTAASPRILDRVRWETTVGAGVPVIATLHRLLASGDRIERIQGALSGTLGYIFTELEKERPFSQVVREAYEMGYTEPDPRDDLGGMDVARKALILARDMGWDMDLWDLDVENLYPPEMDRLSVDEFLEHIERLDQRWADRVGGALAEGKVLRYVAELHNGEVHVGVQAVPKDSPLGRLTGSDNLVAFHTRWYSPNPLVLQGRGAGVDATAAGVLGDIIEVLGP